MRAAQQVQQLRAMPVATFQGVPIMRIRIIIDIALAAIAIGATIYVNVVHVPINCVPVDKGYKLPGEIQRNE